MKLNPREKRFRENMIKGRVAETIIQEMFLSLGYKVFHYGMEHSVPGISELIRRSDDGVATNIRSMPDFVVVSPDGKLTSFVEVKFRANELFTLEELSKDYPWENTYFIVVSRKHIKCITYKELKSGKSISPKSRNYLDRRKEFALDKDVIIEFCQLTTSFFENA